MRLYELLTEYEFPQIKTHKRRTPPDLYNYEDDDAYHHDDDDPTEYNPHAENPDIKNLGTGAFASAYQHKDTPHDVTKGSKASYVPDGFQALFTALSKDKEAQANPYFPRFRSINKFQGEVEAGHNPEQKKRSSYVLKVEKLEPYSNLSKAERKMLMNKIFTGHGKDIINHNTDKPAYEPKPGWKLAAAVRAALENEDWGDELRWAIRDEKFKEAIEFLQKSAKEYNYEFDLHSQNMMIRRTSVGVQLVINDPMGFSSGKSQDEEEIEGHPDWE